MPGRAEGRFNSESRLIFIELIGNDIDLVAMTV